MIGVFLHQLAGDAVGPAEAVLQRILAAAGVLGTGSQHVLLHQLVLALEQVADDGQPALLDVQRQRIVAVVLQPTNANPLQRCPAIGPIPLLAAATDFGGGQAAWRQQALLHRRRHRRGLLGTGHAHEQRGQRRGSEIVALPAALPVVVEIGASAGIPQVLIDCCQARLGTAGEGFGTGVLVLHRRQLGDLPLQLVEQRVEVDRQDAGGADGRQPVGIVEPARAEIPARLGTGAQVAIDPCRGRQLERAVSTSSR